MNSAWRCALFTLIATAVQSQFRTNSLYNSDEEIDYAFGSNHIFIEPEVLGGDIEVEAEQFEINNTEYIFLNDRVTFKLALQVCKSNFQAELAFVKNFALAKLLAEALSETNLMMDALWIAARKDETDRWEWVRGNETDEAVDQKIINNFTYNVVVKTRDRRCLAFSRTNHDIPQFRPLACWVRRSAMCERPGGGRDNNSTHPGWIKIGRRYYKIFQENVNWIDASVNCQDINASLAVLVSSYHAQLLGRYLLIGRPSLENAWIGADWNKNKYSFEVENVPLSNVTDNTGYPPWINHRMTKPGGCILLDRHLSGNSRTWFVEDTCRRLRPYVCYKIIDKDLDNMDFTDVIIGDYGYRLHNSLRNWNESRTFCLEHYVNYSAFLTEIQERVQVYHLLYVMGENKTAVQHIWTGGKFTDNQWTWYDSSKPIKTGNDSILNWIRNSTYNAYAEDSNTCLVMDRENHIVAMHYGTRCTYEHNFVCQFTAENLLRRQKDEKALLQKPLPE